MALTVVAYPPTGWWPLALVAWVPLLLVLHGRSPAGAFGLTWLYSAGMALVIVRWVVHALAVEYDVAPSSAWLFTAILVGSYALIPATAAAAAALFAGRLGPVSLPPVFSALWVLGEWLRSEPGGLPWILAGHSLARVPLALQTADLGGALGVGFVLLCLNAGLALAILQRRMRPLVLPLGLVVVCLVYGALRMAQDLPETRTLRVGVVQASVPPDERFQPGSAERNTAHHGELTRTLASAWTGEERLDLVVWSETAVDVDLDRNPRFRSILASISQAAGVPLVTGAPRSENGRPTNAVVLVTPDGGLVESYDKMRLVPFSEYDPALTGFLAPLLGRVTEGNAYEPGKVAQVLGLGPARLATPVCFEITYPSLVRGFAAGRAELLLNLSNDAWFGRTGYADMHFDHAIFRAVELRTWVVRVANTGVSGVVDPWGRVVHSLGVFEEGTFSAEVGARPWDSFYTRFGDLPVLICLILIVACGVLSGHRGRRGEVSLPGTEPGTGRTPRS